MANKTKAIKDNSVYKEFNRMDAVGQNGNDGSHYDEVADDESIQYIEKHYPETAAEFQRLQYEQWALFCKKQMDYGPSNIAMGTSLRTEDERRLSKIGLIVRINDKVQRLMNLVVKNNREAQNEPTMGAFKDLSVYGIIAQIVDMGKWGK